VDTEDETLNWPTNLDHAAIVLRLVQFRNDAKSSGLADLAAGFATIESMPAANIGVNVLFAMNWLRNKPEYQILVTQLDLVAMNLKNLR